MPELLQTTLRELDLAKTSKEVWGTILQLGTTVRLPYIDLVYKAPHQSEQAATVWKNYNSDWLDRALGASHHCPWTAFRAPLTQGLTPRLAGQQFLDKDTKTTAPLESAYEAAASNGLPSSFVVPVSMHAPPYKGTLSFSGDASRRETLAILRAHGWALQTVALVGFTKLITTQLREFSAGANITEKQSDILRLLGEGLKDREIADCLGVTVSAVRQRMTSMSKNTGLHTRAELAALAMSLGLLSDPTQPRDATETNGQISLKTAAKRTSGWGIRRPQAQR
ncbi:MAG: hypothetical protein VXZ18_11905 [Pseudomonadota bacterium]|nr:hypothetical protein [Pseudomonadota bacterium]